MKFKDIWAMRGENLAESIDDDILDEIGKTIHEGYRSDRQSRSGWEERNAEALKIALQVKEKKSFPWPDSSNVKLPLVTMACVQYNARSYGALVGDQLVSPVDGGEDAWKITKKVNNYIKNDITHWEEDQDKLLMVQALVGCPVKKTYVKGDSIISELILPDRFVVDYYAKRTPRRQTHINYYDSNEIKEEMNFGFFREMELEKVHSIHTETSDAEDMAHGNSKPPDPTGHEILEVHCWWDLDEDGYEEPYVIHIDDQSQQVLRMATRFSGLWLSKDGDSVKGFDETLMEMGFKVAKIEAEEFFTKYPFIPSPDGSWYDIGFGTLLMPINEAADSILNQLIDAGTDQNTSGGLVARNVRIGSGRIEKVPGRWKRTEASAQDLQKGIFPWPRHEPSHVLMSLLQYLMGLGQRMGSVTESMTGENPGQNQAATTTMAVLEQGMQVHNAIYKRTFRSQTSEIRKIFRLLKQLSPDDYMLENNQMEERQLQLTADPNISSFSQRMLKAQALVERTQLVPHLYGPEGQLDAEKRLVNALQINNADNLLANPQAPQDPNAAEMEFEKMKFDHTVKKDVAEAENADKNLKLNAMRTVAEIEKDGAQVQQIIANIQDAKVKRILEDKKLNIDHVRNQAQAISAGTGLDKQSGNGGLPAGTTPAN